MAIRFDADTDRITYSASNPPALSSGITIVVWLYLSVDRNDYSTALRMHAASGATTVLNIGTSLDGQTPGIFTPGLTVSGASPFAIATWYRVAVTVTGVTGTLYTAQDVAGATQIASGAITTSTAPTGFTIGGRSNSDATEWFNGRMAYLRMWSAVLTQSEIEAEWQSTTRVRNTNIWGDYELPGASTLTDASGANRHLSAGATAVTTEDGPAITGTTPVAHSGFMAFF